MKTKENLPVFIVTGLFLIYCLLLFSGTAIELAYAIFFSSPFLMAWMAYSIIHNSKYAGKELNEDEEWGYADKRTDELKLF
jgi:hypothetical protein